MNRPKCDELDYIHFLIAAQKVFSNTEAARSHPEAETNGPVHDAYTSLVYRIPSDGDALWQEVQGCVQLTSVVLVSDDSTLDKPYARAMDLVTRHWSGKHHQVVMGINLISILWTDGDAHWPCDFRIYDRPNDNLTKNDHFQNMPGRSKSTTAGSSNSAGLNEFSIVWLSPSAIISVWLCVLFCVLSIIVCKPEFPGLKLKHRLSVKRFGLIWLIRTTPWVAQLRKTYM